MKLRREIEPQLERAEKLYPEILKLVMNYATFCDEHGDEENREYKRLENKLHALTGKDISKFNLWEWWEEEGAEVLAFRIALLDPKKFDDMTEDEVFEIVNRILTFEEPDEANSSFEEQFKYHLDDFYHELLSINVETYDYQLFTRQKDKDGNYFEYSAVQIVEKLFQKET
jgi:hypothetical protein